MLQKVASTFTSALARHPPIVWANGLSVPWPRNHRFAMWKFDDLHDNLLDTRAGGMVERPSDFATLDASDHLDDAAYLACHGSEYYHGFVKDTLAPNLKRRIGFTQRPDHDQLVSRTKLECSCTVKAARLALEHGVALSCAGGTHHAHRDWGSGFTALNDLAIAATLLRDLSEVQRVLIVDLDVHQGDGTAEILKDEPNLFTMSMHCAENFPLGFYQEHLGDDKSDLDIGLASGTGDTRFLATLADHLPHLLDTFRPDLVLYDAGVDPYIDDQLGKLALTSDGLYQRDSYVMRQCIKRGVPVAAVIGGGYDRDPAALAQRHATVHRASTAEWLLK